MKVNLIVGDITKLGSDIECIVNAANNTLLGGGGVDGAIHHACGSELYYACKKLGGCETGNAKYTAAYNLPQKYIIHTVGPIYDSNEEIECAILLKNAYLNSLKLADELGVKSICFPSISTGAYGYPIMDAAEIVSEVFYNYEAINIKECYLISYKSDRTFYAYAAAFSNYDKKYKIYQDDNFIKLYQDIYHEDISENRRYFNRNIRRNINRTKSLNILDSEYKHLPPKVLDDNSLIEDDIFKELKAYLSDKKRTWVLSVYDLIQEKELKNTVVYKRSGISKQTFSKMMRDINYKPSKDTAVALCFGLGLDYDQAIKLINLAGYSLSESDDRDKIFIYLLRTCKCNVSIVNNYIMGINIAKHVNLKLLTEK